MCSVVFLSAPVMCFLWASFLDLYFEDGVCTVESVVCLLSSHLVNRDWKRFAYGVYVGNEPTPVLD
jgi:hypothetical protein